MREFITRSLQKLRRIQRERGLRGLGALIYRRTIEKYWGGIRYQQWLKRQQPSPMEALIARAQIAQWPERPKFSIIMPVYNVEAQWLERAIASVQNQIYPDWELCIADDASTLPHVQPLLKRYQTADPDRIKLVLRSENGHIAAASNSALALATGEYIALLDHDDELATTALWEVARLIQQHPDADLIYSDEDKLSVTGQHFDPFFKPDWSPEYLLSCMYIGHLGVYQTELVRTIGGFRTGYDGSQDYDLALRVVEQTDRVYHLPKVLYHWRTIPASSASQENVKPWAYEAALKALNDRAQQSAYPGWAEMTSHAGLYRVRRHLVGQPLVSLIIPSAGKAIAGETPARSLLEQCLDSVLERSTYRHFEVILVDGYDIPDAILTQVTQQLASADIPFQLVRSADPFNFSARINQGAAKAAGDYLLLLNDDVEVITPDWLESMLELAQQPAIGAVGAKLSYPNGRIQHIGVMVLAGSPIHAYHGESGNHHGYFGSNLVIRNYLAVTGACLMIQRDRFHELGGLDAAFPLSFNDVDLCLKAHQAGFRNVVTPYAHLIHHESMTRDKALQPGEWAAVSQKWRSYLSQFKTDPYYNPNLSHHDATFEFTGVGRV